MIRISEDDPNWQFGMDSEDVSGMSLQCMLHVERSKCIDKSTNQCPPFWGLRLRFHRQRMSFLACLFGMEQITVARLDFCRLKDALTLQKHPETSRNHWYTIGFNHWFLMILMVSRFVFSQCFGSSPRLFVAGVVCGKPSMAPTAAVAVIDLDVGRWPALISRTWKCRLEIHGDPWRIECTAAQTGPEHWVFKLYIIYNRHI